MPLKTVGLLILSVGLVACGDERVNVLSPDGSSSFVLMNFAEPFPLDPVRRYPWTLTAVQGMSQ